MLRREEKSEDIINAINSTECSSNNQYSLKDYGISAQILRDLGVLNMRLMGVAGNMPNMSDFGLNLTDFIPTTNSPAD
jgi:3,4-dihydroxy 2-butanone 4-phosphate synthase/GTP cyclohydrolase II